MLAGLGIYGVISYMISQRISEIGARMALGAEKHDVLRMVVRQGLKMARTFAVQKALGFSTPKNPPNVTANRFAQVHQFDSGCDVQKPQNQRRSAKFVLSQFCGSCRGNPQETQRF